MVVVDDLLDPPEGVFLPNTHNLALIPMEDTCNTYGQGEEAYHLLNFRSLPVLPLSTGASPGFICPPPLHNTAHGGLVYVQSAADISPTQTQSMERQDLGPHSQTLGFRLSFRW